MIGLTALLVAAALAHGLAKLTRLPVIPWLVVAGFGVMALGGAPEGRVLASMVELGLVFLVFAAGVELTPRRMARQGRAVLWVGGVQFLLLGGGGWLWARWLGFEVETAAFIALALAASSTVVVVGVLKQRQQLFESFGRLVTGVLLLQDAAVVLLLVALAKWTEGWAALGGALMGTAGLGVLAWAAQRWVMPWLVRQGLDEEGLLVGVLALLAVGCGAAAWLGVPWVAGAFMAGVALSGFPMNGLVRGFLTSLTDFFLALFFVALGGLLVMPSGELWLAGLVLSAWVVLGTVPVVAWVAERVGLSTRAAVETGLLLAQTSEFSLVIALYAWMAGLIEAEVFSMLVLMTVGTMALTPAWSHGRVVDRLVKMDPRRWRRRRGEVARSGHVVFTGIGTAGERVLRGLLDQGQEVLVLDEDAGVVAGLMERGVPAWQADGSSEEVLARVNARRARAVVCSLPRQAQAERVARYLRGSGVPVIVRVFDPADGARLAELGATPVVTSTAAVEKFMGWARQNGIIGEGKEES